MSESNLCPSVVSRNGELIPPAEATISVLGSTLYGAFGVYESIQLWNGVVFHLEAHLERLFDSAAQIHLPLAGDLADHRAWIDALVDAEGATEATIRLFSVGPERPAGGEEVGARSFLWLEPVHVPDAAMVAEGVGAVTYRGERAVPNAKSLNTLVNTLARQKAAAAGEHEGLLLDQNDNVREGASSNVYVVRDQTLLLPPPEAILDGVTLQLVLRLATEADVAVARRPLPISELSTWDEAFLTSTSRHVLPMVRLDKRPIGDGAPGPVTRGLQERFEAYFEKETGKAYRA